MNYFRKIFFFAQKPLSIISLRWITAFSIIFAILAFFSYLFQTSIYFNFCGDIIYSPGFSKCIQPFKVYGNFFKNLFLVLSLTLTLFSFTKVFKAHKSFSIFLGILTGLGVLLSLLLWDNDSGGFFNLNFGPPLLGLTFTLLAICMTAFSWGFLLKQNYMLFFPFLILILIFISNIENIPSRLNKNMTSPVNNSGNVSDCKAVRLDRARDKCVWSSAIHADSIEQCNLIVDSKVKTDCLNFVYRNRGTKTKDKKWCDLITDRYQKNFCLN